ncbi:MAG: hypothetical protein MUP09_00955 [Thiovulaceae bacterium]|nr:hypothetical protein [Sulfurimonadaceae bacterium]
MKPYLQYFEEFLHDLCIETNVEIHSKGIENILSIEPKDREEALNKISEALQIYLSAPVLINKFNADERLLMTVALNKLHTQCVTLDSDLTLKAIALQEQAK